MTDPLGQSQVIPHLQGLIAQGHRIAPISFETRPLPETAGERSGSCSTVPHHLAPDDVLPGARPFCPKYMTSGNFTAK